jgi:hypothetical protein
MHMAECLMSVKFVFQWRIRSMAEFDFCNMTNGTQSARHEWKVSAANKNAKRAREAEEAEVAEASRREEEERRRKEEEEEEEKREEERKKQEKEDEELNKPWWSR